MRQIVKGSTDQSTVIRIINATDGTPETGVEHDTAGIDLWYRREGATKTSITEAALASLDAAHSDGGIEHIGDGYYRLDPPDAAWATGANGVMVGGAVTGMIVIGTYHQLVDYDPYASNLGLNDITVADILAGTIDGTLTLAQAMMVSAAVAAGNTSGGGTDTIVIKGAGNTTTRITATVDENGNRTVVLSLT